MSFIGATEETGISKHPGSKGFVNIPFICDRGGYAGAKNVMRCQRKERQRVTSRNKEILTGIRTGWWLEEANAMSPLGSECYRH